MLGVQRDAIAIAIALGSPGVQGPCQSHICVLSPQNKAVGEACGGGVKALAAGNAKVKWMLHHSFIGCPWTSDLTPPSFSFLIYKLERMMDPTAEILRQGLLTLYML